jgi:peptidylprolyl isomerase
MSIACFSLTIKLLIQTSKSPVFLCTDKTGWLDGKHVVFGQVVQGMEVIDAIEAIGSSSGKTSRKVLISECGELSQ